MSETLIVGVSYRVTWLASPDACGKCSALNGKEWELDDLDEVPLIQEMSSHPHCRCTVDVEIDVDPLEFQIW
jgi:hypothetical protein